MSPADLNSLFSAVVAVSWRAAWLILALAVLRLLVRRRIPAQVWFVVWILVAARLLLPFSIPAHWSPYNFAAKASAPVAVVETVLPDLTRVDLPDDIIAGPVQSGGSTVFEANHDKVPVASAGISASSAMGRQGRASWSVRQLCVVVWIGGMLLLVSVRVGASWRFRRQLRSATPLSGAVAATIVAEESRRAGLRVAPVCLETTGVEAPALYGLFRPRLLLPPGLTAKLSADELRHVIRHELGHCRRRDLFTQALLHAAVVVHWFNPLAWLAARLARTDCELACDEFVLRRQAEEDASAYGETLLKVLGLVRAGRRPANVVAVLEGREQLAARIRMIANYRHSTVVRIVAGVVLVAGIAVASLTRESRAQDTAKAQATANGPASTTAPTPSSAAPAAAPVSVAPNGSRQLVIKVLETDTEKPVAGAMVWAAWVPKSNSVTDAKGIATLSLPEELLSSPRAAQLDVEVRHPDFAQRMVNWRSNSGRVGEMVPAEYTIHLSRGVTVGGVVHDEHGLPIAGANLFVSGSNLGGVSLAKDVRVTREASNFFNDDANPIITDAAGAWRVERFPADLTQIEIRVRRPDGAETWFTSNDAIRAPGLERVSMTGIRDGRAILTLKDGTTVRGTVVDQAGKPVPAAELRVRDGGQRGRWFTTHSGADGSFELPHRTAPEVVVTIEQKGFQTTSATIALKHASEGTRIVLPAARPLQLRIVGEADEPLSGAEVQTDPNLSDPIVKWTAHTGMDGRVVWDAAPGTVITYWINPGAGSGYPIRIVKIAADGAEHVVRLRKGADKSVTVQVHAVDANTGAAIPRFEVWRRMPNQAFEPWAGPGKEGSFSGDVSGDDFPNGIVPAFRLQVKAAGYGVWTSDVFEFAEGDQDLRVALTKGVSVAPNEPRRRSVMPDLTVDTNPSLGAFADTVVQLLQTGDAAAFVKAVTGPALNAEVGGISEGRVMTITLSAAHFAELARRVGINPGRVRFKVKTVTAPGGMSVSYKGENGTLRLTAATFVNFVLAGTPVDAAESRFAGDYVVSFGHSTERETGWATDDGLRWVSLPPNLANGDVLRELQIANTAAPAEFGRAPTLGVADDPTLEDFGNRVAELLRNANATAFVTAATFTRDEVTDYAKRLYGEKDVGRALKGRDRAAEGLAHNIQGVLDQLTHDGVELADAKIDVNSVLAGQVHFNVYGDNDTLNSRSLVVTLTVESRRKAASGQPVSGKYVIATGMAGKANGRWVLVDEKIRWQSLPNGLLADAQKKSLDLENYVADHGALPPGTQAPEISVVRLADNAPTKLSAYRGKVVLLEFWASWCGPCQEPMEKLQHLRDTHPDWKDKVEVITVSIDDTAAKASEHLTKKGWNQSMNTWAGKGGFNAESATAFRIRGVPTSYVIDASGRISASGHPATLDFGSLIDTELSRK